MRQKGAVNQSRLCGRQSPSEAGGDRKEGDCCLRARQKNKGRAGPALACLGAGRGPAGQQPAHFSGGLDPSSPSPVTASACDLGDGLGPFPGH